MGYLNQVERETKISCYLFMESCNLLIVFFCDKLNQLYVSSFMLSLWQNHSGQCSCSIVILFCFLEHDECTINSY